MSGLGRVALRAAGAVLHFPIWIARAAWRVIVPLFLAALLVFNVALFTVNGFYAAASSALSAAGIATPAVREATRKAARQKAQRRIVRTTSRNVTRRVQRGAARSIASAAGEAIPFVGAGVVAGALVLEVNDACATARDMAGLEAALGAGDDPEAARRAAEDAFDCTAMIREELPGYEDIPTREDLWEKARAAPGQAYEQARNAGIALSDIDWSGWVRRWFLDDAPPVMDAPRD
ncbi:hypothetical protein [Rhodovulum marinum]|uniref:Uncharacterized protein n=1 Tax=Rhodovulum marinum TaxID=320662 RepID=A0A4R2PWL7_9RHOB|nr:hypothetical protein [Rhodovulum marinum]TCP40542.1 hypothetical protein EV662_107153 [Rhodovulum marinum]